MPTKTPTGPGSGFIKTWKVTESSGQDGMPMGQHFSIALLSNGHFKMTPGSGPEGGMESDWAEAEFELEGSELKHHFESVDKTWRLRLDSDGKLQAAPDPPPSGDGATDPPVHPWEAGGTWEAQEEGGG